MRICCTIGAKLYLSEILAREWNNNPDLLFRIWESTSGRYNDAQIKLKLTLDEASEDDEKAFCCGLPFIASKEFLSLRGGPHIFCIYVDEDGHFAVCEF